MSSVGGGGFRARGRGNTQRTQSRGGSSSSRGRARNSDTQRDNSTTGGFGKPSRPTTSAVAPANGPRKPTSQTSAFGMASSRGSWQERYQSLTKAREQERTHAIRQGLIADPEKPRSLSEAITPTGTCQDMCAEYERVQRVVQKDVWDEETDSNQSAFATTDKEPDEARMVKKFRRAAAGLEEQLPSDLRPPHVLKQTCDYLFDEVIQNAQSLAHVHHFVWDRTRAIRNDFSIQQVTKPDELRLAIECYERIARFHILSLHQLALPERPYSKYDGQQEREQLDRTLLSLMQYYDDCRGRIELPNEAEFRAYCVIFQLQNPTPDLDDRVQTWSKTIVQDSRVQRAMDLYVAACNVMDTQGPLKPRSKHLIARQDWQRFWVLVASKEVSYLMACVAEVYFSLVRRMVLNALLRAFRMNSKIATTEWTIEVLCDLLAFDDGDEVYSFCDRFGFSFAKHEGRDYLDLNSVRGTSLPEPKSGMPKQSKSNLVENKRYGRSLPAVINGLDVRRAEDLGFMADFQHDEDMEGMMDGENGNIDLTNGAGDAENDGVDDEESLFIPEARDTNAPRTQGASSQAESTKTQQPSLFSGAVPGTSSFGKPSNFSDQSSIFALNDAKSTPASNPGSTGSMFNFSKPSASPFATGTKSPPLFNFSQTAAKSDSKPALAANNGSFGQPSKEQPSIFASAVATTQSAPAFSFGTPTQPSITGPKTEERQETSQFSTLFAPKPESPAISPEHTRSQVLTSGQATGAPAGPSVPNQQTETKLQQHQVTSTSPTSSSNTQPPSTSGFGLGVKRQSFSTDTKPRKPSPLSHSFTANEDSHAAASAARESVAEKPLVKEASLDQPSQPSEATSKTQRIAPKAESVEEFDARISLYAHEIFYTPGMGLLTQFVEYEVKKTITETLDEIVTDENNRAADEWRQYTLHHKYGTRWREIFWQRRLAKTGRERRERRKRRMEQRGSRGKEDDSLYESQSNQGSSRAGSITGTMAGVTRNTGDALDTVLRISLDSERWSHPVTTHEPAASGTKRPMSLHQGDEKTSFRQLGHKRLKSTSHVDERGRISKSTPTSQPSSDILSRSSFLGFSTTKGHNTSNKDTTKSNYFRHKAMGLHRHDDVNELRGTKRLRSESLQLSSQTSPPGLRSSSRLGFSPEQGAAAALMPPPTSTPSRTARTNDEDDALFARLKAARETLKESASYLKSETAKSDGLHQSVSSQSSSESPSMARARIEARLHSSHTPSESGLNGRDRTVPAYRLRESRFMPREQYGRAVERAKEMRESRSRDTSRPESRSDGDTHNQESQAPAQTIDPRGTYMTIRLDNSPVRTSRLNGIQQSSDTGDKIPAQDSTTKPSSFGSQTSFNFANHTTQLSSENPFLQAMVPNSFNNIDSQPIFGFVAVQPPVDESQDHTIRPTQIRESLANSFDSSYGLGQSSLQFMPQNSPTPPQQNSYMQSQAISLLSDDENDVTIQSNNNHPFYNTTETEDGTEELLDEATDDDVRYGNYDRDNTYQGLARNVDEDQDSQDWISRGEDQGSYDEDLDGDGYENEDDSEERFLADTDEEGADADIDENEEETEGSGEDEDEDEDEEDEPANPPLYPWQGQREWVATPAKNEALQGIGHTVEEAIELSD